VLFTGNQFVQIGLVKPVIKEVEIRGKILNLYSEVRYMKLAAATDYFSGANHAIRSAILCGRRRAMSSRGFTLIEILIVVIILGIAAAMAIPLASSAGGFQLTAAADMVAADMEYARSISISRGRNYSVVFDTADDSYKLVVDSNGTTIPHTVNKGDDYVVDFADEGLEKVHINSTGFDSDTVSFDYLGSPYEGGGSPLNSGSVTLQAGSTTKTVNVEPVTGFISICE